MKDTADMKHRSIINVICPYDYSCSVCRLHSDYEAAKEKAKKLEENLREDLA